MGKNVFGGSKHKGMARKTFGVRGGAKMRKIQEEGEIYAGLLLSLNRLKILRKIFV